MSTAAICGAMGSVTGVTGLTEVTNWQINLTMDSLDATSFSSEGWKQRVGCLVGATGTFDSIGEEAGVAPGPYATAEFLTGDSPALSVSGAIIVTERNVQADVNGVIKISHSFVFTGQPECDLVPDYSGAE